jgi:CheY-like chemotaxis protein
MSAVLVVDDDAAIGVAIAMILTDEGHLAVSVRDGVEALDVLEREQIDLIICDVMMPRLSGVDLISRLRDRGNDIPVVLISAGVRDVGTIANTVFLRKPFDVDNLLRIVEKMLTEPRD